MHFLNLFIDFLKPSVKAVDLSKNCLDRQFLLALGISCVWYYQIILDPSKHFQKFRNSRKIGL